MYRTRRAVMKKICNICGELISWYTSKPFYNEDRLNNIIKYMNKGGGANANDTR